MKRLVRNLFATMFVLVASRAALADDLFSEVSISSVFARSSEKKDEAVSKSGTGRRFTGPASLRRTLTEAGFRPQDLENGGVQVVVQTPATKSGQLNVVVRVDLKKDCVVIAAPLVKIDDAKTTSQSLLRLMDISLTNDGVHFAAADNTLNVRRTLENKDVSMSWLKLKIHELVDYANANATLWQPLGTVTAGVHEQNRTTSPTNASFSLVGRWSAVGSKRESLGVVFETESFKFAIVANGKVSRSDGTWTLNDDQLVLSGEGMKLSSKVTIRTSDQIVLKFNFQAPLTFTRQK